MNRRKFLGNMGVGLSTQLRLPKLASAIVGSPVTLGADRNASTLKAYGSGYLGSGLQILSACLQIHLQSSYR
jgi:hypothetical protein